MAFANILCRLFFHYSISPTKSLHNCTFLFSRVARWLKALKNSKGLPYGILVSEGECSVISVLRHLALAVMGASDINSLKGWFLPDSESTINRAARRANLGIRDPQALPCTMSCKKRDIRGEFPHWSARWYRCRHAIPDWNCVLSEVNTLTEGVS